MHNLVLAIGIPLFLIIGIVIGAIKPKWMFKPTKYVHKYWFWIGLILLLIPLLLSSCDYQPIDNIDNTPSLSLKASYWKGGNLTIDSIIYTGQTNKIYINYPSKVTITIGDNTYIYDADKVEVEILGDNE